MKKNVSEEQSNAILKALDEAIENGPWQDSSFLRVIGKNLQQIRDKFANEMDLVKQEKDKKANLEANPAARTGQQEVFVSLYTSNGAVIQNWERVIANLPQQIISRPIYADEADITNLIRSKENRNNEGYVAIYIQQSDILPLPPDKIPKDRFEKPLITIKNKAITLANISRFVHSSGVYTLENGRLVKKSSAED